MVTFEKAYAVISMWVDETTSGPCEVVAVDDKPYGWVFYYFGQDVDEAVVFDRISAEIIALGAKQQLEESLERYESRLTRAQISLKPELSGFVNVSAEESE